MKIIQKAVSIKTQITGYVGFLFSVQLWLTENWTLAEKRKNPEAEIHEIPVVPELSQQHSFQFPQILGTAECSTKIAEV